jgi:peptide deformylase
MAVREVVIYGDERLRQPAKEVHKVSSKIQKLVDDMYDTMYSRKGVGFAAPQIGVGYRVFVIDAAVDGQPPNPITFINPKIIKKSGAMNSLEGCLSFPDVYINVRRYANVIVRAKDLKGRTFTFEAKDGSLLAKALQHENDHLDGITFVDHARNRFEVDKILAEKGLPPIDPKYLLDERELEEQVLEWEKLHPPTPEESQVLD